MPAKRILLVEDDLYIRDALSELLTEEGFHVLVAENGRQGIDILKNSAPPPDLILFDLMMPVMDGFQFRREQLELKRFANIPVIVMSADGGVSTEKLKLHANACIKKPVEVTELISTISSLLLAREAI